VIFETLKAVARGRIRFVRFLAVGALNTLFGYSVFASAIWLGVHFTLAAAIATVLGTLFNFKTTGVLVFGSGTNSRFVRFLLVYAVIYGVNVAGVGLLLYAGANTYISGLLMVLPLALLSYFLNSQYVFKHE
jgi:putative flippase GtrA